MGSVRPAGARSRLPGDDDGPVRSESLARRRQVWGTREQHRRRSSNMARSRTKARACHLRFDLEAHHQTCPSRREASDLDYTLHCEEPTATQAGLQETPRKYFSTAAVSAPIPGPSVGAGCFDRPTLETMLNGYPVEVGDLDAEWVLDLAAEAEVRERQAGRGEAAGRGPVVCAHPATVESGSVTWSDTGLPGVDAR